MRGLTCIERRRDGAALTDGAGGTLPLNCDGKGASGVLAPPLRAVFATKSMPLACVPSVLGVSCYLSVGVPVCDYVAGCSAGCAAGSK